MATVQIKEARKAFGTFEVLAIFYSFFVDYYVSSLTGAVKE